MVVTCIQFSARVISIHGNLLIKLVCVLGFNLTNSSRFISDQRPQLHVSSILKMYFILGPLALMTINYQTGTTRGANTNKMA